MAGARLKPFCDEQEQCGNKPMEKGDHGEGFHQDSRAGKLGRGAVIRCCTDCQNPHPGGAQLVNRTRQSPGGPGPSARWCGFRHGPSRNITSQIWRRGWAFCPMRPAPVAHRRSAQGRRRCCGRSCQMGRWNPDASILSQNMNFRSIMTWPAVLLCRARSCKSRFAL